MHTYFNFRVFRAAFSMCKVVCGFKILFLCFLSFSSYYDVFIYVLNHLRFVKCYFSEKKKITCLKKTFLYNWIDRFVWGSHHNRENYMKASCFSCRKKHKTKLICVSVCLTALCGKASRFR